MGLYAAIRQKHRLNLNVKELVRIIGYLVMVEATFMLIPFIYSLLTLSNDAMSFALSIGICVLVGASILLTVHPRERGLGKRDGVLLTTLIWVIFSLFGMLPFMFSDMNLNFAEAFFEAISGFTTTGASVVENVEDVPRGIQLWRCVMQWLGGIGIIIFTVALLPIFNSSGGMQLFNAEVTGVTHDKLLPRISQTAKRFWVIYSVLTIVLGGILWVGPLPAYEAVCQSLSTVSTGGFSTCTDATGAWDSMAVRIPVIIFMFLGGVNFVLIYRASLGQMKRVWSDINFRSYVVAIMLATIFVMAVLLVGGARGIEAVVVEPLFQVVSMITSTGYTVDSLSTWGEVVVPVLLLLMMMGACAGSTSGGVKIDRVVFMYKNARNEFKKIIHPNRYYPLTVNGMVKPPELVNKVAAFFLFYVVMLVFGGLVLTIMGLPLKDAYFSTISCIGNIGLGMGVTEQSYAAVPDAGKMILSFIMLVGRLEIFTVIVLFSRHFWRR